MTLTVQSAHTLTPGPAAPPPEPTEPPPVIHGSVIGYRAWRIVDWQLCGTGVNRAWVPGVNEATCDAGDGMLTLSFVGQFGQAQHLAPAIGCHCGITSLARFTKHDHHWPTDSILGAIEAWSEEMVHTAKPGDVAAAADVEPDGQEPPEQHGRFILHDNGFRSQFGKVVLLAVDEEWPSAKRAAVRALAREHSADVCKLDHLEDAAKEHGQLVPDDLLKWAAEADPQPKFFSSGAIPSGGFIPPVWHAGYANFQRSTYFNTVSRPVPKSPRAKGIKQTLGYPGPPAEPTAKHRKGHRIKDSKGTIWVRTHGGKGGTWAEEEK